MSRLQAHLSKTCFCVWCSCVLTVRPLNWRCCICATFHRDAPLWVTTGCSSKQEKSSQGHFHISCLPGSDWTHLCVCPDYPSVRVDHRCMALILSRVLLFPNIQKCVPGSCCRISSALLPYGSISQSSISFACSFLLIWLFGYTKHIQN